MSTIEHRFTVTPEIVLAFREEFASVLAVDPSEVGVHGAVHIDDAGVVTVRRDQWNHWVGVVVRWFTD